MEKQVFKEDNGNKLMNETIKNMNKLIKMHTTSEITEKNDEISQITDNLFSFFIRVKVTKSIFEEFKEILQKYPMKEEFASNNTDSKYYKKESKEIPKILFVKNDLCNAVNTIIEKLSKVLILIDSIEVTDIGSEFFTKISEYFAQYSIIDGLFKSNYYAFLDFFDYFIEDFQSYKNERKEDK